MDSLLELLATGNTVAGIVAAGLAGAFLFRVRGGLLNRFHLRVGTQWSRIIYAAGLGGLVALLAWDYHLLAVAPALFVGAAALPWWSSIDMGRDGDGFVRDFAMTTARGLLFSLPGAAPLWALDYGVTAAAVGGLSGLVAGLCYEAGWRIPSKITGFKTGTEMGEALLGAAIGLGLAVAATV